VARKRLPNLLDWLRESSPDVVCLQELKATDAEFPIEAIRKAGYEAIWRGQKTWNGVAILSRRKPIQTLSELPGDPDDKQSRYIEAAVPDELRLFRSIATMNRKAPLPPLAAQKPTWAKAADLARTWGLDQLADRLTKLRPRTGWYSEAAWRSSNPDNLVCFYYFFTSCVDRRGASAAVPSEGEGRVFESRRACHRDHLSGLQTCARWHFARTALSPRGRHLRSTRNQ
jgi:hypothetical protein